MTWEGDGKKINHGSSDPIEDDLAADDDHGLEDDIIDEDDSAALGAEYRHLDATIDSLDACLTELDKRNDELMAKMREHLIEMRNERAEWEAVNGISCSETSSAQQNATASNASSSVSHKYDADSNKKLENDTHGQHE